MRPLHPTPALAAATPPPRCPRPAPITRHAPIDARKLALARRFRRQPTPAESLAWQLLRGRRILGLKFRRQQLIRGFCVDLYCPSLRLVLELDGGVHADPAHAAYDAARSRILSALAIRVVRLPNHQVNERSLTELLAPYAGSPLSPARPGPTRARSR
jgi:very-short-patch-repair endonuclease